jgi:predicted metal-dependent hydrolase
MTETIAFGSKEITFKLEYSARQSLGITVTPDLEVIIKAPEGASIQRIKELVRKRAPWILRQQSFFLTFHPKLAPRQYVSGETHLYLGRQYRLQITNGKEGTVKLKGGFLEVTTTDYHKVRKLITNWYKAQAKTKFELYAEPLIERFRKYNVEPTAVVLRDMPTRWGSCTPGGKIILNPELIKAPKGCIEYVIVHELCHLVHHDHTQKFIDLQANEMPDWEKWKTRLETLLA